MILLICRTKKNDSNEPLIKQEHSQTQRMNLWISGRKGEGGRLEVWD